MRLVLVGNNDGPLILLDSLQKEGIQPVGVGLQKPASDTLRLQYHDQLGESEFFSDFDEAALLNRLAPLAPDLLINCFCNFKFTDLLEQYNTLNVHLAPLPRYRGRHPLHWALINGEAEFGVSIHRMTPEIDAGDIMWQRTVRIAPGTSVAELRSQLMNELRRGFGTFVRHYRDGEIRPQPNRDEDATYVARRFPADSELTEWHDRDTIYRKVTALRFEANPAFVRVDEQTIPIKQAEPRDRYYVGVAAPFVSRLLPDGVEVVCNDGKSVALQGFDPKKYAFHLNQRLSN